MILRLLYISRPVLWINTVGPATIGMWLAGDLFAWGALPVLLWLTLPFNLLIYGVNDVFDQETDAKNPRKGSLEGARIDRSEVSPVVLGVILTNAPVLIYAFLFVPISALAWMLLYALLFLGYSVPPARFKARPYLDSLSNAAYALPLVFVPLALGRGRSGQPRSGSWRGARPSTPSTLCRTWMRTAGQASSRPRSGSALAASSSGAVLSGRSLPCASP